MKPASYGNGRAEARYEGDFRFGKLFDTLAGIGRKRVDIVPLPLGIDRIKGKRGFSSPGGSYEGNRRFCLSIERERFFRLFWVAPLMVRLVSFFAVGAGGCVGIFLGQRRSSSAAPVGVFNGETLPECPAR